MIDLGTTGYELSLLLATDQTFDNLMVATNDLYSACAMADNEQIHLIMLGGKVRSKHYSVTGFFGENMMDQMD